MTIQNERLHALDALRAIMMLLGVVIHTYISYTESEIDLWYLKDYASSHYAYEIICGFIHTFRMPIFFVVAGFFGGLIFFKKSPAYLIKNRVKRILVPFILSLFLLWPIVSIAFVYSVSVMEQMPEPLKNTYYALYEKETYFPSDTMHLWFLNYLIYYILLGCIIGFLQNHFKSTAIEVQNIFNALMKYSFIRPVIFSFFTFILLILLNSAWPDHQASFIPHWKPLCNYFIFYLFGWLLFSSSSIISSLSKHSWSLFFIGLLFFICKIYLYYAPDQSLYLSAAINSLTVWFFIFGIIGLFMRYLNKFSKTMRYISDASYWIYLIHYPIVIFLTGLFMSSNLPSIFKSSIVFLLTSLFCWMTYKFFVRNSFIGVLLNGKRISN